MHLKIFLIKKIYWIKHSKTIKYSVTLIFKNNNVQYIKVIFLSRMSALKEKMANDSEHNDNNFNNFDNFNDSVDSNNENDKNPKNKKIGSKFRITIEPYLLIAIFGMMLTYLTMQNLMLDKACRINLDLGGEKHFTFWQFFWWFYSEICWRLKKRCNIP